MIMHEPAEVERRAEELSRQTGLRIPANFQVIVASGSHATADEREWTYVHRDGSRVPVNIAITAMRDDTGRLSGFLKVAYDITERPRAEAFIRSTAHHDPFHNLPKRALLTDRLEPASVQPHRHPE